MDLPIIDLLEAGTFEPAAPEAQRIIDGDPHFGVWNAFSSPDGRLHLGQWRSTAGVWRVRYTEYEFCHLLTGRVRLCPDAGVAREFKAGDSFMIPKGFSGTWQVLESCLKVYVIYEGGQ